MGSEASLWKTVQKNMKSRWEAQRIENPVGPGTPDVYYTMKSNGSMGWIELKHEHKWPKRTSTTLKVDHFTPQQRNWLRRHEKAGAKVFVLIQVEKDYFLIDGTTAADCIGDWTKEDFMEYSLAYWPNRISYTDLEWYLS